MFESLFIIGFCGSFIMSYLAREYQRIHCFRSALKATALNCPVLMFITITSVIVYVWESLVIKNMCL